MKQNLLADVDRLRGGAAPGSMDKYIPLIYKEKANLFTYLRGDILFLSEPNRVKERMRTTLWQLEQDETALLEEGLLCRRYMSSSPIF